MRRTFSITTILALLLSMASPLMAACTGTGKAVSCHAMEMAQDAQPMHEHHHHDVAMDKAKSGVSVADDAAKCPMDCCTPGHPRNGAAVAATSVLPPLAMSDLDLQITPITFTIAGFSSHTDRGPPLA
ncbi:MAG TPA: hypothetical protein VH724_12405 [Candidatus Angelobacter sp.]|nr:hypothetical protein [Candidatus Angelobacter sp.]